MRQAKPGVGTLEEWRKHEIKSVSRRKHIEGLHMQRTYRNTTVSQTLDATYHVVPAELDSYSTAPQSVAVHGSEARRLHGRFQLPKLSVREDRLIKRTVLGTPRLAETAQPGNRRLAQD